MTNPNDTWICPNCGKDSGYVFSRLGVRPTCFDCKMLMIRKPEMWPIEPKGKIRGATMTDSDPTRTYSDAEIEVILMVANPNWDVYGKSIIRQLRHERNAARAEIAQLLASLHNRDVALEAYRISEEQRHIPLTGEERQ